MPHESNKHQLPPPQTELPQVLDVVADLELWRKCGVTQLSGLNFPALSQAAIAAGLATTTLQSSQPAVLRDLVRRAISAIGGSVTARSSLVLLGLDPNTFDLAPHLLREDAAEIYGLSLERFRREPQRRILNIVADLIIEQCLTHQALQSRLLMEQRHPADTRLAVHWLERFEAYFDIWTPTYALGADITAYRATLIESPISTPVPPPRIEVDPKAQAHGYASFALHHFARVLAAERHFTARFGGLWLLSTPIAEAQVRDSLHSVLSIGVMNERDLSWIRMTLDAAHGEMHAFLESIGTTPLGRETWEEWEEWLSSCNCTWIPDRHDSTIEYFPTPRYQRHIMPDCSVHQLVEACNSYCTTIEDEWRKIADWYGIDALTSKSDD